MDFTNDCSVVTLPNDFGSIPCRSSKTVKNSRFSIGFEALDRYMFKPEPCYDLVAETGVKWARCMTGWRRCEPEKGVYDFAWLDDVVDNLLSRGIQPWFNVGYGNKLYMDDIPHEAAVGCVPLYYGEEAKQAWCDYITALTLHFEGRVNHFEIWNESNGDAFWLPKGASGKEYTELVALTSTYIRQVNLNAKVAACLFGVDIPFIRECLKSGMGEYIQFFALHPYGNIPEIGYVNEVKVIRSMLSEYAPHVKLWQGECGCPSQTLGHHDGWLGLYNMDETKQAKWVARRLLTDFSLDFDLISYFHATDLMESDYVQADGKIRPPVMMGLLNGKSYTPKIAYQTFCGICSLFDENTQTATLYARPYFNVSAAI